MPISAKQIKYLGCSSSFNVAEGAVSSGKTFAQILRWYDYIYNEAPPGSLLLMSGKTSESLYDNIVRDLEALNPTDVIVRRQPLRVHIKSKSIEIACADANNERSWGRVQGKTVWGWLADEVTQYPASFTRIAQSRCRGGGQIRPKFWTCNPDHPDHYILTDYLQNEALDLSILSFTLDDNPILDEAYKDELKASYSGVFYERYILGKWVLAEGSVYPEFRRDIHVVDEDPPTDEKGAIVWERIRSIDYGYTNPFVCLWGAVDEDGRLWIYDEHYESRRLLAYHAEAINAKGEIRRTVADHDAQDNAEMRALGVRAKRAKKDVVIGIQKVKTRLAVAGDERPRLYVHKRCKNTIREFGLYRWADPQERKAEKEEPLKVNDHAMDALRYMVMDLDYSSAPRVRAMVA